jgi:hypothetical protein
MDANVPAFEGRAFASRNEPSGDKLSACDVFEDIFAVEGDSSLDR